MNTTLDIDFARVEQLGDAIIPRLNAVRDASPIYWSETDQSWVISGHAEVVEAFSGRLPLSAARFKLLNFILPDEEERRRTIPNMLRYFPHFLINLDPPDHTRVRRLMLKPFSGKVTEAYRPHAREVIQEVLDVFFRVAMKSSLSRKWAGR